MLSFLTLCHDKRIFNLHQKLKWLVINNTLCHQANLAMEQKHLSQGQETISRPQPEGTRRQQQKHTKIACKGFSHPLLIRLVKEYHPSIAFD
jgi:hypothetical protein